MLVVFMVWKSAPEQCEGTIGLHNKDGEAATICLPPETVLLPKSEPEIFAEIKNFARVAMEKRPSECGSLGSGEPKAEVGGYLLGGEADSKCTLWISATPEKILFANFIVTAPEVRREASTVNGL